MKNLLQIVKQHKIVLIQGTNGSGKTYQVEKLSNILGKENNLKCSYAPQSIEYELNVKKIIKKINFVFSKRINFELQASLMKKFNIKAIWEHSFKKLSTGQKKMVLLFITLIIKSDIYIFDEIDSGLDKENLKLLKLITNKCSKAIIISHWQKNWPTWFYKLKLKENDG